MKISYNNKLLLGFLINAKIVVFSAVVFALRIDSNNTLAENLKQNWVELSLFALSILLLVIVANVIRTHAKANDISKDSPLQNKKLFRDFLDLSPGGIFIKRLGGEYELINKKFMSLARVQDPDLIIGKTDQEFMPQAMADAHRHSDYEVAQLGRPIRKEVVFDLDNESHTFIVDKFPINDQRERIYAIGGLYTDITERKKLENSLMAGNKFFNMSADIMMIGTMEKFIKVNPMMVKTLGYSEEELLNGTFFTFLLPEDFEISHQELDKLQTGALTVDFENRWISKDGSIKTIRWSVSPELATGLIYAVGRDVTIIKETEKSLEVADRFFNISFEMIIVIEGDHFARVNPAFTKTLGYSQSEIVGIPYMSLTHPDEVERTTREIDELKKGESVSEYRVRVLAKDGSYKWLEWTGTIDLQTNTIYICARDVSQLIEKEESLLTANNFFEQSFDAFVVVKEDKILKINPAFNQITGYDQEDLVNMSYIKLIRPDYVALMQERREKRSRGEQVSSKLTVPLIRKDGSLKWIELNSSTDMESHKSYTVLRDVTERELYDEKLKMLNQQLKDEQEQIQTIFDHAPDPIIVIDADTNVIRWNPKAEAVFGWPANEVIGKPIYGNIIPPRFAEIYKKNIAEYLASDKGPLENATTDTLAINKQGAEFPVSLSVSPIIMDGKDYFIGFVRDITLAKKAVEDLEKNEKKLKLILENIGEGVIVANPEHKIILVNQALNEILETKNQEDISLDLAIHFELYYPDGKKIFPAQYLPMEKTLEGNPTDDLDIILVNRETKKRHRVLITGKPLLDQNNNLMAAIITIKDITKYKELEEELKQSEKELRRLIGYR